MNLGIHKLLGNYLISTELVTSFDGSACQYNHQLLCETRRERYSAGTESDVVEKTARRFSSPMVKQLANFPVIVRNVET